MSIVFFFLVLLTSAFQGFILFRNRKVNFRHNLILMGQLTLLTFLAGLTAYVKVRLVQQEERDRVSVVQQCTQSCEGRAFTLQGGICYCATGMNVNVCKQPLTSP